MKTWLISFLAIGLSFFAIDAVSAQRVTPTPISAARVTSVPNATATITPTMTLQPTAARLTPTLRAPSATLVPPTKSATPKPSPTLVPAKPRTNGICPATNPFAWTLAIGGTSVTQTVTLLARVADNAGNALDNVPVSVVECRDGSTCTSSKIGVIIYTYDLLDEGGWATTAVSPGTGWYKMCVSMACSAVFQITTQDYHCESLTVQPTDVVLANLSARANDDTLFVVAGTFSALLIISLAWAWVRARWHVG